MFAVQSSTAPDELAIVRRVTDLNALFVRVNNPGDLRPAGKEVLQPRVNFRTGIVRREDFDGQIGRAGEEAFFVWLETECDQPRLWDKGNIRRSAVAIEHPKTHAGIEHHAKGKG